MGYLDLSTYIFALVPVFDMLTHLSKYFSVLKDLRGKIPFKPPYYFVIYLNRGIRLCFLCMLNRYRNVG